MKRFRFRLESVRTLRELAERKAREQFGLAQQKVTEAAESLHLAKVRRSELISSLAGTRTGRFRPADQVGGMAALRVAEKQEIEAERVLAETEKNRDRVREDWLLARRGLQIIQKLEERARFAHRDAADKAEQSLLDELGSMAAARLAPLA